MREEGRKETVGSASCPEMLDHTVRLFFRNEKVPGFCRLRPAQVIAIHSAVKASSSVSVLHLCQHNGVPGMVLQAPGTGLATLQSFILAIFPSYSASVRLPASTIKLGEKLERYHTAIQVGAEGVSVRAGAPARVEGTISEPHSHSSAASNSDFAEVRICPVSRLLPY